MARTVLLGKTAWRVLKRYRRSLSLQPLHTEYPHTLLMQDPLHSDRWGHFYRGSSRVTLYRKLSDDLFEKTGEAAR